MLDLVLGINDIESKTDEANHEEPIRKDYSEEESSPMVISVSSSENQDNIEQITYKGSICVSMPTGANSNMKRSKEGEDVDGRDITSYRAVLEADLNEDTVARFTYMNFEEDDNRARAGRQMCKMTETPAYGCHPSEFGRDSFQGPGGLNGILLAVAGMASFSPLDTAPSQPLFGIRETYQAIDPVYKVHEKLQHKKFMD